MALSQAMQAMFKDLKGTKPVVDACYFQEGTYWCRIDAMKEGKNRAGVMFLAIETTVVKVVREEPGKSHRVGANPSKLFMSDDVDYFKPEIVTSLGAIFGLPAQEIGIEEALAAFGDDQPCRNMVVEIDAKVIMTQRNTPFTKVMVRREVPPQEVLQNLEPATTKLYFPNNYLENLIKAFQDQAAAAQQAA